MKPLTAKERQDLFNTAVRRRADNLEDRLERLELRWYERLRRWLGHQTRSEIDAAWRLFCLGVVNDCRQHLGKEVYDLRWGLTEASYAAWKKANDLP